MSKRKLIARILGYTLGSVFMVGVLVMIGFVSGQWYMPFVIFGASFVISTLFIWIRINWDAN